MISQSKKIHIHHFHGQTHAHKLKSKLFFTDSDKKFQEFALIVPLNVMSKLSSAKAVDTIQRITLYKVVLQLLQHFISYFHVKTIRINGLIIQLSNTSFRLMLFYFLVYDMGSQILYVNTNMTIFLIRGWVWLTSPVYVLTIVTKHQQSELV